MRSRLVRRLLRSVPFTAGFVLLLVVVGAATVGPLWTTHDPYRAEVTRRLLPPGWTDDPRADARHALGTDQVGRDILTRLLLGGRWSLGVAVAAAVAAAVVGVTLGVIAGYVGGITERVITGFADVQLSIPAVLLAIAVVAVLGPSIRNLVLVLILTGWVVYARTIRAQVLSIKHRDFILSARALGGGAVRILTRHVVPNVLTPVIVILSQQIGFMILMETALSFLGLGIQPPIPSWGGMINEARLYLPIAPWTVIFPGLALMLTVLGVNLLGDGLRDALDPKTRA